MPENIKIIEIITLMIVVIAKISRLELIMIIVKKEANGSSNASNVNHAWFFYNNKLNDTNIKKINKTYRITTWMIKKACEIIEL